MFYHMKSGAYKRIYEDGIHLLTTISILIILWYHHIEYVTKPIYDIPQGLNDALASFAIGSFVFISGFKLINSNRSILAVRYIQNRFLRIFPLYYVALLIFALLLRYPMSWEKLFIQLFGGQLIFPLAFGPFLPTLWFVGLISFYYFLFLLLRLFCDSKIKYIFVSSTLYLILFILSTNPLTANRIIDPRLCLYFPYFVFGIYFGKYTANLGRYALLTVLIYVVAFAAPNILLPFSHLFFWHILIILAVIQTKLIKIVRKPIVFISFSSYASYLFHRPIWHLMRLAYSEPTPLQHIYTIFLGIPTILVIGFYIQFLYVKILKKFYHPQNTI